MSLSSVWKSVRGVVAPAIGAMVGGPIGGVLGSALAGGGSAAAPRVSIPTSTIGFNDSYGAFPGTPAMGRVLPALPGAGRALGNALAPGGAYAAGRAAGRLTGQAMSWCKRNPAWCSSIGLAGIEAALASGQLPKLKRRRTRGISGAELRAFRRVVRFTSKYCAPIHKAKRAPVMRSKR